MKWLWPQIQIEAIMTW